MVLNFYYNVYKDSIETLKLYCLYCIKCALKLSLSYVCVRLYVCVCARACVRVCVCATILETRYITVFGYHLMCKPNSPREPNV